jgi:hypothetical protein
MHTCIYACIHTSMHACIQNNICKSIYIHNNTCKSILLSSFSESVECPTIAERTASRSNLRCACVCGYECVRVYMYVASVHILPIKMHFYIGDMYLCMHVCMYVCGFWVCRMPYYCWENCITLKTMLSICMYVRMNVLSRSDCWYIYAMS